MISKEDLKNSIEELNKASKKVAEELRDFKSGKHTTLSIHLDETQNKVEKFFQENNM